MKFFPVTWPCLAMKVHLIQIVWHRSGDDKLNSPIMSLSFHPRKLLLATAAQDKTVKVSPRSLSVIFRVRIVPRRQSVNCGRTVRGRRCGD